MAADYKVEQVLDRLAPDGKGAFVNMVEVTYTIPEGYRGSVSVPKLGMTPELVKKAVEADVKRIKEIYAL
jgi:hypothetical protein